MLVTPEGSPTSSMSVGDILSMKELVGEQFATVKGSKRNDDGDTMNEIAQQEAPESTLLGLEYYDDAETALAEGKLETAGELFHAASRSFSCVYDALCSDPQYRTAVYFMDKGSRGNVSVDPNIVRSESAYLTAQPQPNRPASLPRRRPMFRQTRTDTDVALAALDHIREFSERQALFLIKSSNAHKQDDNALDHFTTSVANLDMQGSVVRSTTQQTQAHLLPWTNSGVPAMPHQQASRPSANTNGDFWQNFETMLQKLPDSPDLPQEQPQPRVILHGQYPPNLQSNFLSVNRTASPPQTQITKPTVSQEPAIDKNRKTAEPAVSQEMPTKPRPIYPPQPSEQSCKLDPQTSPRTLEEALQIIDMQQKQIQELQQKCKDQEQKIIESDKKWDSLMRQVTRVREARGVTPTPTPPPTAPTPTPTAATSTSTQDSPHQPKSIAPPHQNIHLQQHHIRSKSTTQLQRPIAAAATITNSPKVLQSPQPSSNNNL
ncbi:hypothetical protein Pelo_14973 [Pelomyxa schiedti]|nr:hypothetical protein Pelo_14973 [Pelomyxa schiedti]